jgi:SagB-type dehydrogenase family enzyme
VTNHGRKTLIAAAFAALWAIGCAKTGGQPVTTKEKTATPDVAKEIAPTGEGTPLPPFDPAAPVALLPPRLDWGPPLMTALSRRHSSRSFAPEPLDLRIISDLLWAATGVNRPETGGRTAPTARNRQDLDVYAVTADGAYLYEPARHALAPVAAGDLRAAAGVQEFVAAAPLNLVYVSDLAKIAGETREDKIEFAGAHAGFAAQNVYLFCAAADLAAVVRAYVDKPALTAALRLRPEQLVVLAQTVGRPGPPEPPDAD